MARAQKPALKIGTSAFVFPIAIERRLRPLHTADLFGEQLLNSRSDRLRFRRWLGLLGHGDLFHIGLNLYGAFGVKRFSLSSAQSSILFKFLCSVGEPFL